MSAAPVIPRRARSTPASASSGPTRLKLTRDITNITTPSSTREAPRTQFSRRVSSRDGLYNPRAPHNTRITPTPSQPSERRSKKMCPVAPSHTTNPPNSTNSNSTITRKNRSVESKAPPTENPESKKGRNPSRKRAESCARNYFPYFLTSLLPYFVSPSPSFSMRTLLIFTGVRGRSPESRGTLEILSATSWPSTISPKMVCLLSSQGVAATVIKNWLPLVFGPELAIESLPGLECFNVG